MYRLTYNTEAVALYRCVLKISIAFGEEVDICDHNLKLVTQLYPQLSCV